MKKLSEEHRRKISESLKGRKRSKEIIAKMSAKMKGKNAGEKSGLFKGHFYMTDIDTGQKWKFASTHECSKFARNKLNLSLCQSTVCAKLNGKHQNPLYLDNYSFDWCKE